MFSLVKPNVQVFRAKFSEITPNSIRRACETLTEPDANISDAVDVRQELDLRIGDESLFLMHVKTILLGLWDGSLGNSSHRIITVLSLNDNLVKC